VVTKDGEILALIMVYLTLSLVFLFLPGAIFYIALQTNERLKEKDYKIIMKESYKGLKIKSLWTRLYFLPFMLRRIIYVVTAFLL